MSERLLHKLWYQNEFAAKLETFKSYPRNMSIVLDNNRFIQIDTADGEPSHAKIEVINLKSPRKEEPITFEDVFTLYHAAINKDPDHNLTRQLESIVIQEIHNFRGELNRQLESADILETQIKNGAFRPDAISRPHP